VLSVPALNAITSEQPFARFLTNPQGDPLWLLHELDVIDKHRRLALLRQLWAAQRVTIERPTPPGHRAIRHELIRSGKAVFAPARDGAMLFEVELSAPPGTHFHVETQSWLGPAADGLPEPWQPTTSFATGWQRGNGGGSPSRPMKPPEVHLWFGAWQDGAGNVVQYRLIASREADHSSEQVDAYAVYWPTAAAHAARGAE
jgi:hypothetical protein